MLTGFNQGFELSTTGGWKTYFDCDFRNLPATTYADGAYTVQGKQMTVANISSSGSIANVAGVGLVWTLDSGGVNKQIGNMDSVNTPPSSGVRSAPLISFQMGDLIPGTVLDDTKRMLMFFDMGPKFDQNNETAILRYEQAASPLFKFTQIMRDNVGSKNIRTRLANQNERSNFAGPSTANVNLYCIDTSGLFVTTRYKIGHDFNVIPTTTDMQVWRQYVLEYTSTAATISYNGPTDRVVVSAYDSDPTTIVDFTFTLKRLVVQRLDQ
jgi:hypothetical protein